MISDLAALSLMSNFTRYPFPVGAELLTFVRKKKKALERQQRGEKVRGLVIYRTSGPVFWIHHFLAMPLSSLNFSIFIYQTGFMICVLTTSYIN